jgi:hypothetical protein
MYFPKITATSEQVQYAKEAVMRSLKTNFTDYWNANNEQANAAKTWRLDGFLGEVLFADAYGLPRPTECYGLNGQDEGRDFVVNGANVDVKTTTRRQKPYNAKSLSFMPTLRCIDKESSITDHYFFISLYEENGVYTAWFAGSISRDALKNRKVGKVYKAGEAIAFVGRDGIKYSPPVAKDCIRLDVTELKPVKITPQLEKMNCFECVKLE